MAWNEKALKQNRKAPKCSLDAIDREACAQGDATRFFNANDLRPQLGRRISKDSRKADGFAKTADAKATRNLVADTAARAKDIIIPERQLAVRR